MEHFLSALIGYIIGQINPAFLIGKLHGFDIRQTGSTNAGASNALITMGKTAGFFCAVFDICKALFVVKLADILFSPSSVCSLISGISCITGHIFPIIMGFRGGKGLACFTGMVLALSPRIFIVLLLSSALIVFITNCSCSVPMTMPFAFSLIYGIVKHSFFVFLALFIISLIMFIKHIENIKRLKNGTEFHFSILWNEGDEKQRISHNIEHFSRN